MAFDRKELWSSWTCPHGMRVRTALTEKGIPYRLRLIEPGEALPVLRGAPVVLVDGDQRIDGSLPILEYLDTRWREPPLFPDHIGASTVRYALARVDTAFVPELRRIDRGTPTDRVEALAVTRLAMEGLDCEVAESGYLLGTLSAADLALASVIACLPRDWRPAPLGLPRLSRWEQTMMSRPAVREQMALSAA
jgi:glutathione S-transferase